MTDTAAQSESVSPKPRKKRWIVRTLAAIAILILVAAIVTQIVLWTDLPRGLVVSRIEQQLGLRLTVKSLSTGWLGHTTLNDVTIGLPLADKAFLDVPVMKVKNTSLFGLLIGEPVELQRIELYQPHLYVWQDSSGQWNLQEVAQLLGRAGGAKAGEQSAKTSSSPQVPDVHLINGIISIVDNKKRTAEIQPLTVNGYRDSAVSWKYDVSIPPRVSIAGRLVPGGNWAHEVAIKINDVSAWAKPWMDEFPQIEIDATWRGELSPSGIEGRLELRKAEADLKTGTTEVSGGVAAGFGGGVISLRPDNLLLKTGQHVLPDLDIASGSISYTLASNELKIDPLLVRLFGGYAHVVGDYNPNTKAGHVDARWDSLSLPNKLHGSHGGSFTAAIRQPFPDKIIAEGNLISNGSTPSGPWIVTSNFAASGESFTHFDWTINTGKAQWQRRDEWVVLDGLALAGSMKSETLAMRSISLPQAQRLMGSGSYHFSGTQKWETSLRGQNWPFHPIQGTELAFELKARGGLEAASSQTHLSEVVHLDDFILKSPDVRLSANGTFTSGTPKPLKLGVKITNAPPTDTPMAFASAKEAKIVNGTIRADASLEGTLSPLLVEVRGDLDGREIDVRGHHLGEIDLLLSDQSHIDSDGVFIYTKALSLLGGQWGIDGIYMFDKFGLDVDLSLKDVALKDIGTLADRQDISGLLSGHMSAFLPGLNLDLNRLQIAHAPFTLANVNVAGAHLDQLDAQLSLEKGNLALDPIHLQLADGRGDLHAAINVNDLRRIDLGATFSAWPIDLPGAAAHIATWVDVPSAIIELPNAKAIDPAKQRLRITAPKIDVHSSTTLKGEVLGDLIAHAGWDGRDIDVRAVHMKLLGGRFDGQAHANMDSPKGATAEFTWEKINLQQLALIFPQIKDLKGDLTGDVRLAPSTVPRAREPVAFVMKTLVKNGAWRTVPIKDARIAGYVGWDQTVVGTGWRVVLEDNAVDPSFIHLDEGVVELWGRAGAHGLGSSSQIQLTFHDLDLNKLVRSIEPKGQELPGSVAGTIMLLRAPPVLKAASELPLDRMFPSRPAMPVPPATAPAADEPPLKLLIEPIYGEGGLTLTRANLANFGPFAFLYNFANLFRDANNLEGTGNVQFHLERGTVTIDHLRYFNRGTEIRAVATVDKIWQMPDSPLVGKAILTARPLRNLKLPVLSDFDTVLQAIQASLQLTGVRVVGTVHKYAIIGPLGLTDIGDEMRRFLVGDVNGAASGGAPTGGGLPAGSGG